MTQIRPVMIFEGADSYTKLRALDEVKKTIFEGKSCDLDYKVFYCDDAAPEEIIEFLQTVPFSSKKRLAVVKFAEKLDKEDIGRLVSYAKNPAKSSCLLLDVPDDSLSDMRSEAGDNVFVASFNNFPGDDIGDWIRSYARSRSKTINSEAVEMFKGLGITDKNRLAAEIEKLAIFAGDAALIEAQAVEMLVADTMASSAFELISAIGEGNAGKAISIVSDLVLMGRRPSEIIGVLGWHYRNILKAKSLKAKGMSEYEIGRALKIFRKDQQAFFAQVESKDARAAGKDLKNLLVADLDIKRSRYNPLRVLEMVIVRLSLA